MTPVVRLTRRYAFSASHRLHAPQLPLEQNRELYGKCNNPYGHGHNYVVDVTVKAPVDARTGLAAAYGDIDRLVREQVLLPFEHRNLNIEVPEFSECVPTSENLGLVIHRRLASRWAEAFPGEWPRLEKIRVTETERNIFEVGTC